MIVKYWSVLTFIPLFKGFCANQRGSMAVLFALSIIPVVLCVGAAIDYSRVASVRNALVNAADVGALAAARDRSRGVTNAQVLTSTATEAVNQNFGQNVSFASLSSVNVGLVGQGVQVTAKANVAMTFMSLINVPTIAITEVATADAGQMQYLDFHILLDTSDSMGLVADEDSRTALRTATSTFVNRPSCEFACHIDDVGEGQSRLQLARSMNLHLRIDVAKDGIRKFVNLAEAEAASTTSRFSLETFDLAINNVLPLTADLPSVLSQLNTIEIGYDQPSAFANTSFDLTGTSYLNEINAFPPVSPSRTQAPYIILISDGVQSGFGLSLDSGLLRTFDQSVCQTFKNAGYQVAVIYTKYYPMPSEGWYNMNVAPIYDQIQSNLESCASSSDLFAVGDTPGEIDAAFTKIFNSIRSKIRLSS